MRGHHQQGYQERPPEVSGEYIHCQRQGERKYRDSDERVRDSAMVLNVSRRAGEARKNLNIRQVGGNNSGDGQVRHPPVGAGPGQGQSYKSVGGVEHCALNRMGTYCILRPLFMITILELLPRLLRSSAGRHAGQDLFHENALE